MRLPKIVYLVTHPMSARFLMDGHLAHMRAQGLAVFILSSPGTDLDLTAKREGVSALAVPIEREIRPLRDLISLWRIYRAFRRIRPDIVNAGTPKAGLLGMLAARLARVPVCIYTQRGLRLETVAGPKRRLLTAMERLASGCAHQVFCVSESLRRLYVDLLPARAEKTWVAGVGSSNGVDATRFAPPSERDAGLTELRFSLGIPAGAPVVGFVGRLNRDKGIVQLLEAFRRVQSRFPTVRLLVLGDFECDDRLPAACIRALQSEPNLICTGFVPDPEKYYPLMDVVAFPSFREGFPNVPLQAAATAIPVVAFRATGTSDAVLDGVTGTLVEQGDSVALAEGICRYLADDSLRRQHGQAGRERVLRDFRPESVWEAVYQRYVRLLQAKGISVSPVSRRPNIAA